LNLFDPTDFEKKNNFDSTTYDDVITLINKLNSPLRISNPVYWKSELNKIIDTDEFLNWLAINNAIVNWDSYGASARNYYLYHRSDGRFIWIPWDNNEALKGSPGIVGSTGGNGENGRSLSMNEVTANWPLIRYLVDDATYMQRYKDYLRNFKNNHFNVGQLQNLIENYHTMITPFVTGTDGETNDATYLINNASFLNEKIVLKNHISVRAALLNTYVP
jgi:spore coat protein CotH